MEELKNAILSEISQLDDSMLIMLRLSHNEMHSITETMNALSDGIKQRIYDLPEKEQRLINNWLLKQHI